MLRYPLRSAGGRLPHPPRPYLHLARTLRRKLGPFFSSNQLNSSPSETSTRDDNPPPDPQSQVLAFLKNQACFLDPNLHYPAVEITDTTIMDTVMEHTFEPFQSWNEIAENQQAVPIAGTFVEFKHNSNILLGVVVSEPRSKFNEFHNKLIVLTMDNELLRVYPQDIRFTAYQALEKDWIDSLDILPNRFDDHFAARTRMVTILHQFVACASSMRAETQEDLRIAYSRLSNDTSVRPVSLTSVLEPQTVATHRSYFHQCAKLLSVHWEMCRDPSRWMVPSCVAATASTNIASHRCSNELPPLPVCMAVPLHVHRDVSEFLSYDSVKLEKLDAYIQLLLDTPKLFETLVNDINIWSGKQFGPAVRALIYSVFYPHARIANKLLKLEVLNHSVSPASVHLLLKRVGLFDNSANSLTDAVFSSGVLGQPAGATFAVSNANALERSKSAISSLRDVKAGNLKDHFRHLRSERQYYQDMSVYGLIGPQGTTKMLLSLEKIHERKYLINIHVPDVASHLSPASFTFETWAKESGPLSSISGLVNGQRIDLLDESAMKTLLFSGIATKRPQLFSVGDFASTKDDTSIPCMTLTFEYSIYDNNPLKSIGDKVSVSFDAIRKQQVKLLDHQTLDNTLTGKLRPRLLDSFRLFSRTPESDSPSPVDENDHFNINFIYNTLTRHFLQRNRRCAASINPNSIMKDIFKNTHVDEHTGATATTVSIENPEQMVRASKREFFLNELSIFAGAMAAEYTHHRKIPVFTSTQTILDESTIPRGVDGEVDEVFISHENRFLPNFHGNSYFQTMLARDSLGYVSAAAYFIGNNFLDREKLTVSGSGEHLPLGLPHGFVDVAGALDSVHGYLNQLQILLHHHASRAAPQKLREYVAQFSSLKKYGYAVHGPLPPEALEQYLDRLQSSQLAANYLRTTHRAYWTLVHVQQQARSNMDYNCIITRTGPAINSHATLAWAFCEELAMEIRLYVRTNADMSIGSRVKAHRVLHVDPVGGVCVMEHSEPY